MLSAQCCVLCAVCCVLCAVCCVLCAVCCVLCVVCCVLCAVCCVCVLCAVCCVLCAVCCVLCVLCVLCVRTFERTNFEEMNFNENVHRNKWEVDSIPNYSTEPSSILILNFNTFILRDSRLTHSLTIKRTSNHQPLE